VVQQQQGQGEPLLHAAHGDRSAISHDLERPEERELHGEPPRREPKTDATLTVPVGATVF
jgi:hypothetical protein